MMGMCAVTRVARYLFRLSRFPWRVAGASDAGTRENVMPTAIRKDTRATQLHSLNDYTKLDAA